MRDHIFEHFVTDDKDSDPRDIWTPQPKQQRVIDCLADITGYGGVAGSGKSDLLAFIALYHDYPVEGALFRKQYKDLDSIRRRLKTVLEPHGGIVTKDQATFPNGTVVTFAHLTTFDDIHKNQGKARELMLFDELAHLSEDGFRALIGWNRSGTGARTRVICATNPPFPDPLTGESSGEWMIDFFGPWVDPEHEDPAESGEIRWYVRITDPETGIESDVRVPSKDPVLRTDLGLSPNPKRPTLRPLSRTFILAETSDNRYIDEQYQAMLDSLPGNMRAAVRDGKWLRAGALYAENSVVPAGWILDSQRNWKSRVNREGEPPEGAVLMSMGVDPSRGGRDATVIAKMYRLEDETIWFGRPLRVLGGFVPDGQTVAALIQQQIDTEKRPLDREFEVRVDAVGIGSSVVDFLAAMGVPYSALNGSWSSSARPEGVAMYAVNIANARTEWYWNIREGLDPRNPKRWELPPDKHMAQELRSTYFGGKPQGVALEDKKEIRKKIGRSPDTADAFSYATAERASLFIGHA